MDNFHWCGETYPHSAHSSDPARPFEFTCNGVMEMPNLVRLPEGDQTIVYTAKDKPTCSDTKPHAAHDWRGFATVFPQDAGSIYCSGIGNCENCGCPQTEFPMIFRGEPYCSVDCEKASKRNRTPA